MINSSKLYFPVTMTKKILMATCLGGAVAFLWNFVSWEILPWHRMHSFYNNAEISESLVRNSPTHGIYMLPQRGEKGLDAEALTKGPLVYAVIRPGSLQQPWSLTEHLIKSYIIQCLCALILALTVWRMKASRFISRAAAGMVMGLFAAVSSTLPFGNWFELPGSRVIVNILDPFICWTLTGLIIAAIVKPPGPRRIFT